MSAFVETPAFAVDRFIPQPDALYSIDTIAHLAGVPSPPGGKLQLMAPLRLPDLLDYQATWRHRLEDPY